MSSPTPAEPITLLLADDHPLVLESLRHLFACLPWIGDIKLARDGLELCQLALATPAAAAIVDLSMPRLDGLSSIRRLRHRHPGLAIVALTGAEHWFPAAEVLLAGADEYLLKNQPGEAVIAALNRALARRGPRIAATTAVTGMPPDQADISLTEREREVLKLLAEGHDLDQSARLLNITPATVRKHREHLYAKFGTTNVARLTLIAVRRGIVALSPAAN